MEARGTLASHPPSHRASTGPSEDSFYPGVLLRQDGRRAAESDSGLTFEHRDPANSRPDMAERRSSAGAISKQQAKSGVVIGEQESSFGRGGLGIGFL